MQPPRQTNTEKRIKGAYPINRILIATIVIALTLLWGQPAWADSDKNEPALLSLGKFTTGVLAAYALHEVGHWAAAELTNTDIDFGAGRYNQPIGFTENADNDTDGMIVHASGLVTQLLVSHVILESDSIDKNDTLVRGMMFWNIVNPIVYALDYWFLRRTNQEGPTSYQGDIEGFENYSSEDAANIFAGTMAMIAAIQGYQYIKTQDWAPDWVTNNKIQVSCEPSPGQGAMLRIRVRF